MVAGLKVSDKDGCKSARTVCRAVPIRWSSPWSSRSYCIIC